MPDTEQPVDLTKLDSDYVLVGELGSTPDCRKVLAERRTTDAKRRDDQTGVVISIYSTPEGDEANALSHLAADTKLLASEGHRRLVPVIEGRWLDDEHFAVVTQRIPDPSVTQRLAGREVFSTVRVAAILRELNGLLEWARTQGVVHRIITGDGVFLEPRTDRVRVMFDVTPIHRVRPADETRDGRTIARLAMAMLAGVDDPDTCSVENLYEMRPELPSRLAEATAELLDVKNASTKTDIANYIALIGMSDPLYRGEEEEKRIRNEILEEQRAEREKLANERAEFEAFMAKERADFEAASTKEKADFAEASAKEKADFDAASAKERSDFQAFMQREHAKLESERLTLQKAVADERAKLQKAIMQERADLTAKREELEKSIAAQKAELERVAALDRRKIEELRAELKRRGEAEIERKRQAALEEVVDDSETELDEEELASPTFVAPTLVPFEAFAFSDDSPVLENDPVEFEPIAVPATTEYAAPWEEPKKQTPTAERNRWLVPGAIGGGVAVVALIAALAMNNGGDSRAPAAPAKPVAAAKVVAQQPAPQTPAVPQSIVPLPVTSRVLDSSGGAIAPRRDSVGAPASTPRPVESERTAEQRAADRVAAREREAQRERAAQARRQQSLADTIFNFRASPRPRPDTGGKTVQDSASSSRRDTVTRVRRDTVAPPDTTKPRFR